VAGQRRLQRRAKWLTLASSFVLVGSLSVGAGYELHARFIADSSPTNGGGPVAAEPSESPTGVGDRSAPEPATVAGDVETSGTPAATPSPAESTKAPSKPDPRTSLESGVIKLTNSARAKHGCTNPLRYDSRLRSAARKHSSDMARRNYFSHDTPEGVTPWKRAQTAGYPNPSAENIAHGYPTAKSVVAAWMASSGHRANILNCESKAVGVGVYVGGDGGPYWTQMFGYS